MTHYAHFFNHSRAILVLSLGFGCNTSPNAPSQLEPARQQMHTIVQEIEQQAHTIESLSDEIRRANPNTKSQKIKQLRQEFEQMSQNQKRLLTEFEALHHALQATTDSSPTP